MRVTAPAPALADALSLTTATARGTKNPLVHVVAADGAVSFTCSATGIAITGSTAADIDEPGEITVSAERLNRLITGFPPGSSITISTTPNAAMIACGDSRYRLPVLPDAPVALAMVNEIARIEIAADDLLTLFRVLSAASDEADRLYLNGLHLHSVGDELVAVATDGAVLLRNSVAADHFSDDPRFIVPTKPAALLVKLIKATKADTVTLRRSGALFSVTGPGFEFITALIDAKYPDYACLLPKVSPNVVVCAGSDLINALARLNAVAQTEPLPLVALRWNDGGPLHLSLPRQPGDANDAIAAETLGGVRIALSLPQLTEMIENFDSARLQLEGTDADRALVVRGEPAGFGLLSTCRWNFSDNKKEAAA